MNRIVTFFFFKEDENPLWLDLDLFSNIRFFSRLSNWNLHSLRFVSIETKEQKEKISFFSLQYFGGNFYLRVAVRVIETSGTYLLVKIRKKMR